MSGEQLEPGTLLNDRYRIMRVIGRGGMGTVYQAEHVRLDTVLAVKEVRVPQTADVEIQSLLEQCEHEARFLVRLHHPNLPQVTDAFLENDRFFVVMEYIEGVNLEVRARELGGAGIPASSVIDWALQIADVLAYLHSQEPPIIFRDLKPANVMVEATGRIRLIDFGIARRFQPGAVKDTNLLGSVGYSPPEQFGRHQTDTRSDIYSFGATLHNLLTGRDPSHAPFKFTPARTVNPSVPEPLSRLIDCCLRLDAEARPQTIQEVAMDLLTIRDSLPEVEDTVSIPVPAAPPSSPSGGANIILTNSSIRGAGKSGRGSQRVPSGGVGSDRVGGSGSARTPSGSVGTGQPPSGRAAESPVLTPSGSRSSYWIGGGALLAAVAGITVWIVVAGARPHPDPGRNAALVAGGGIARPNGEAPRAAAPAPVPSSGGATAPAAPSDTGTAPMTTQSRSVTFDSVTVKDLAQDPTGKMSLRIEMIGNADGVTGDQITIAAYFYDTSNNQIASQAPGAFTSKDGKLSAATALNLTGPHMPFDMTLDVPLSAFPTGLTGGAQFHCVAFYGDQRIGETKTYTPIAPTVLAPDNQATPPADGGGTGSAGTVGARPADSGAAGSAGAGPGAGAPGGSKPADGGGTAQSGAPPAGAPRKPGTLSSSPLGGD